MVGIGSSFSSFILTAQRKTTGKLSGIFERLASGDAIPRASANPAGLAISEGLRADVRKGAVAIRNANDGISLMNIADGASSQLSDISIRKQELAMQSANGVLSDDQRATLNQEYQALAAEEQRIIDTTTFNGEQIFDGSDKTLQVGTGSTPNDTLTIPGIDTTAVSDPGTDISTQAGAQAAVDSNQVQLDAISSLRGSLGAVYSRAEQAISNIQSRNVAQQAADARIRDVDFAEETADLTRNNILQQSGVALLAQANTEAKTALKLLG